MFSWGRVRSGVKLHAANVAFCKFCGLSEVEIFITPKPKSCGIFFKSVQAIEDPHDRNFLARSAKLPEGLYILPMFFRYFF